MLRDRALDFRIEQSWFNCCGTGLRINLDRTHALGRDDNAPINRGGTTR